MAPESGMTTLERPSFLFVHINRRCNLHCAHCDFWKQTDSDRRNYLPWLRKAEVLREFAELSPDGAVVICGGESMLDLEDYFAVSKECQRLGLRSLSVTNGTRVRAPEMADRMIREGPDEVTVSLNSHLEALHDRTRGVPGSFQKAVGALRLLLEARARHPERRTRVYAMGLVFDENYRDLDAFYDFVLNDIRTDKLKLNFLQPSFGHDQRMDEFFMRHNQVDPQLLMETIRRCDEKYGLGLNPVWLRQVGMYFDSIGKAADRNRGWRSTSGTTEHICNSYQRNIMVDLHGVARLCFATKFAGIALRRYGDLRLFWESAGVLRAQMRHCNTFCGISHSVRRESSTLWPNRPVRGHGSGLAPGPAVGIGRRLKFAGFGTWARLYDGARRVRDGLSR